MAFINSILGILASYAVVACLLLLWAYFYAYSFAKHSVVTRVSCAVLLLSLATAQFMQLGYFIHSQDVFESKLYSTALLASLASFYVFSRGLLGFGGNALIATAIPVLALVTNPLIKNEVIIPLAFACGLAYSSYFMGLIYRLRAQKKRQNLELIIFVLFLLMALTLFVLSLLLPFVPSAVLFGVYTLSVSSTLIVVSCVLLKYPSWMSDILEQVQTAYASTTLKGLDCSSLKQQLHAYMVTNKAYTDSSLTLAKVALQLDITSHQLSELVNQEMQCGFSQLLRRYRVDEAKRLLHDEPESSVLSIGLAVGFASQSNFYTAFREAESSTPGYYRKSLHLK